MRGGGIRHTDTQKVTRSSVITYPHLEISRLVGEKGLRGSETRVKTLLVAILSRCWMLWV